MQLEAGFAGSKMASLTKPSVVEMSVGWAQMGHSPFAHSWSPKFLGCFYDSHGSKSEYSKEEKQKVANMLATSPRKRNSGTSAMSLPHISGN